MKKLIASIYPSLSRLLQIVTIGTAISLFTAVPARAEGMAARELDALVNRARIELNVPGIALTIVKDGEVIHAKGYGLQSINSDTPVTPNTLFQIASLTKAFKTAALAILVDEGMVDWDDKVIDYLPDFRMYDAWVTREFTIRDLLTHRSGLPLGAGDLLQWPTVVSTPAEMIRALRHLKPVSSFRSQYDYDNLMYVVAGEVVKVASGMPWEDFVDEQILTPLGMHGCTARPSNITDQSLRATPHMEVIGEVTTTFFNGGSSINCDISGLSKWALMHLAQGEMAGGTHLISSEQQNEMWSPVTLKRVSRNARTYSQTHFAAYGLGWNLMDFRGYLHVSHGGAVQGMTSHIAFLPEKNIAVIALTNQWSRAAQGLTATILDAYASDAPMDFIDMYIDSYNRGRLANAARQEEVAQVSAFSSPPSLPPSNYVGTYRDAWYGDIFVTEQSGDMFIQFGRTEVLGGPLIPHQRDTFIARWADRTLNADAYVTFKLDVNGDIEGIAMKAVDRSTDFSYDFHHLDLVRVSD